MNELAPVSPVSPLRQRLIDDMTVRHFSHETQRNYLRDVGRFATWLGRSPHTAVAEDLRRFQIEQQEAGVPAPTMNSIVAALRFFFNHTLDRPDLARKLVRTAHARKIPVVLTLAEVKRLLDATTCLKHQAALSVAYGAGLRVAEVAALKVSDIDSKRMLLRIERGKGGRYRNAFRTHEGFEFAFVGTYQEISEDRIVLAEQFEGQPGEARITTTFAEENGKTTMKVVMQFATQEARDEVIATGMTNGAGESYDELEKLLHQL